MRIELCQLIEAMECGKPDKATRRVVDETDGAICFGGNKTHRHMLYDGFEISGLDFALGAALWLVAGASDRQDNSFTAKPRPRYVC